MSAQQASNSISACVRPHGAFRREGSEVLALLNFGASAGVIEDGTLEFEQILQEVSERGELAGAVEARRHDRRHARGRLGGRI